LINVDVSASTGAFVETVCLTAVRHSVSGRTGCRRCGRVGKTPRLCSSTCLAPLWSGRSHRQRRQQSGQMDQGGDIYKEGARQVKEQRPERVLPTLPHLRHPVRPKTERRTAIRPGFI